MDLQRSIIVPARSDAKVSGEGLTKIVSARARNPRSMIYFILANSR